MPTVHFATCPLCEAVCGLAVTVEGQRVIDIRGDRDDPFSRGHICPKAAALVDIHDDPDRLRRPVRRQGSRWHVIDWAEAFDRVVRGLRSVQRRHGRDAVALYLGNPNVHSLGAMLFVPRFARALGTRHRFSATSVDQLPHHVVAHLMFGHQLLLPVPDIDRTAHLLVLGANPVVSNGSLMTAPDLRRRLQAIRARGGRIVVVDPRRTETAAIADEHHFIRPGADAALLLAMLHTLVTEGLINPRRLRPWLDGLDRVTDVALRYPPPRVTAFTGIAPDTIGRLARTFATAPTAVAYGRLGVCTQAFGTLACWLITVLNVLTGRLDAEGGAMFTRPAIDLVGDGLVGPGSIGRWRTRVRGLPAFGGELPVATLAEEIDSPGEGRIRALVTIAGNPVLSTPNGGRLERALAGLEFMAAIDCYVNETTRHAHVILPVASPLERDHYDLVFNALAVRNVAKFSPAPLAPAPGTLHDWQILATLTERLAAGPPAARLRTRVVTRLMRRLGPRRLVDLALRRGPYGAGWWPWGRGLRLRTLLDSPHGLDLGPLRPCLPDRLRTPDRRIRLAPEVMVADLARLDAAIDGPAVAVVDTTSREGDGRLLLIGRRDLRSNNSWMHNSRRLMKGRDRCTLLMHPDDAAVRGLADGQVVRVASRVGAVTVPLEVSDAIARGVVSLPHGWGHGRDGVRLAVATVRPGASINDVTDDQLVDAVSGNAAFTGVAVEVTTAASSSAPPRLEPTSTD